MREHCVTSTNNGCEGVKAGRDMIVQKLRGRESGRGEGSGGEKREGETAIL